jgi:hypothetical protein
MAILGHPADCSRDALLWGGARYGGMGVSKSKQSSRPEDATPTHFTALRDPLAGALAGLLGVPEGTGLPGLSQGNRSMVRSTGGAAGGQNPLAGIPGYQGEFAANMTGNEGALLQQLMGEGGARQGLLNQTLGGQFTNVNSNPFAQGLLDQGLRKIGETYEGVLGRTLPGQFAKAGQMTQPGGSSAFDRAAAIQSRGFSNALSDFATNFSSNVYEGERGRQQEAIQLSQQEVDTTIKNLQSQALPRLIQQYGIDQGVTEFRRQTDQLLSILQILSGVSQGQIASSSKGNSFSFNTQGGAAFNPSS